MAWSTPIIIERGLFFLVSTIQIWWGDAAGVLQILGLYPRRQLHTAVSSK